MGWKWGCQPFSFPCSQNVRHCRKEIYSTCLFKTSIPAVPFWNSKHPVSTRSRFLRATVCSTSSALCLHHACKRSYPFVEGSGFVSRVEKQRVWSRSCGLQGFLRTIQWLCPRFGLQDIVGALSCDTWLLQTNEQLSRLSFYQQCLGIGTASLSGADVRKMWSTAEGRFTRHVCLRHPFRPFHFGIPSIQSLPEAGSWERQYAPPVLHYACIMPIPSLYLQKNAPVSCREAKRLVKQLWSPRFYINYSDCALSCAIRLLQTNEQLSRLSF